jgi:hypothetical protein
MRLLQQYFSTKEQCFSLITNQHKPNFNETNRNLMQHSCHGDQMLVCRMESKLRLLVSMSLKFESDIKIARVLVT